MHSQRQSMEYLTTSGWSRSVFGAVSRRRSSVEYALHKVTAPKAATLGNEALAGPAALREKLSSGTMHDG